MSISNIKELFCKRVLESDGALPDSSQASPDSSNVQEISFRRLSEADTGIAEYIGKNVGIDGVIKQRFSDFHVHEIDKEGNVVRLTNFELPVDIVEPVKSEILDQTVWDNLGKLDKDEVTSVEIDVTTYSKEQRRDIHKAIKSKYGSTFVTNTVVKDEQKLLTVAKSKTKDRTWPDDRGKYLHFVLYKSNLDTMEAINILATKLHTKASNFMYAGTKDKRAKTSQWVSMWHLDAKRLNSLNKCLREMKVGNFVYKNTPLKLGDLKGNHFEIALRNVQAADKLIDVTLNELKSHGFINYFGLQRFGSSAEVPTYEIGKVLVKGDFKTAVELILKPRNEKTYSDLKEARKLWWNTRDASQAFRLLRAKDRTIEGKLLLGLSKHGKNAYVNALESIPRNTRLLYLHSYQSLIWNKVLSRRIQKFGLSVIQGDLIEDDKTGVRSISKEEVDQFQIYDIVHPLPGHSVTYPNNEIHEWYQELLEQDDLSSEKLKQTVRQYALSGTYRHIVKQVKNLSWKTQYYTQPEDDLILSDADKLETSALDKPCQVQGQFKALVLQFSLDSSTYATMALREILKVDTSSAHQATLNSYSNKRVINQDESMNKKTKI